jgi:large-conductance mechanosensitive channel
MLKSRLLKWEVFGFLFISGLGSAHHYTYTWLGAWRPLALIAPVNESTWEHFKLAFWPALVFALIEWPALRQTGWNFVFAKTAGLYLMPLAVGVIFYTYTAFVRSSLAPNIASFLVAVALGQWVSYRWLAAPPVVPAWGRLALIAFGLLLVAFLSFTFFAPHVFLFADPITGRYGIYP